MSHADRQPGVLSREVATTEYSWCKAVPGGTGITVLSLLLNKCPDTALIQNALDKLLIFHPILSSKLRFDPTTNTFSFITPQTPRVLHLHLRSFDLQSTSHILQNHAHGSLSSFQKVIEHELNQNPWSTTNSDTDVSYASVYTLEEGAKWVVTLKLHTAACDRTAAISVARELMGLIRREVRREGDEVGIEEKDEVNLGIEEYIPSGKMNKPFWARGMDMLGYSLNSLRLSNLDFVDADSPRCSEMVRLHLDSEETSRLLEGCQSREIKLCGALAAAGLIAARSLKQLPDGQWEKYAVAILIDCRAILEPPLSRSHVGFYHSAIINTHDLKGGEELWELAGRTYQSFQDAKNGNKHFSDMSDLNFLMCRAIENPSLTPSSSLRTSFVSMFEDSVIDATGHEYQELGIEDYVGCASVHGVGPSMAIFDTIRDGQLDCALVYPAPLHSREQMQDLVDQMKRILVDGCNS
ncbi:hypothetical protein Ancab_031611 [Ancistrocladus abbreviatus]